MSCSDRHIAMEVGQHDVASAVQRFAVEYHPPSLLFGAPVNASGVIVDLIGRLADVAKVAQSVIRAITVDVVDLCGLFAVKKEPRNPMSEVCTPLMGDTNIPVVQFTAAGTNPAAGNGLDSADDTAFGVVPEVIADRIRDNFRSHAESPLSVVRGSVVGATDTPILPQFASSGRKYGEPKGHPPFKNHRHPL